MYITLLLPTHLEVDQSGVYFKIFAWDLHVKIVMNETLCVSIAHLEQNYRYYL